MIKKHVNLVCILIFISFSFGIIWQFVYTMPNEYKHKDDIITISPEVLLTTNYDYFNGLFLIGDVLGLVFLLVLFDVPSFEDIYHGFKRELKNKLKEVKNGK